MLTWLVAYDSPQKTLTFVLQLAMATAFSMEEAAVAVVVVPFPAQSHLNTLLRFSLLLSSRGLPVHYAAPAAHIRQAKSRSNSSSASLQTIHFHPLPIPPFSSPPPDPSSTVKFPAHVLPMFDASDHLRPPLAALLQSLSAASRRLVVVHDPLMSFAGEDAAALPNAEVYQFYCISALYLLSAMHGQDLAKSKLADEPIPKGLQVILAPYDDHTTQELLLDFINRRWKKDNVFESGTIINTCRALESEFLDLLAQQPAYHGKKLFAIFPPISQVVVVANEEEGSGQRHRCLQWLDEQPPASVVYVSFGTTSTMSDEQIEQLAAGLRQSGQRFIWVLRDADRGDIFTGGEEARPRRLPPEFEKEVEGTGMVVRGWAPQLEILAHPSTGGFMSHCGWNSCMEGMSLGVPILAWPTHSDQPRNALLVTEYWKVGVMIGDWGRSHDIVSSERIEEAIKRVMVINEEGKEMRRRAKSLGEEVRRAMSADGGSSTEDLLSFVNHITR